MRRDAHGNHQGIGKPSLVLRLCHRPIGARRKPLSTRCKASNGKSGGTTGSKGPPPPRVVTDSSYSLKQQLRFIRNIKKWEAKQGAAPAVRTKFRKRKPKATDTADSSDDEDPNKQAANNLANEELLLSKGRGISSLYDTKASNNPPAILVDGYNLMMLWIKQPGDNVRKRSIAHDFTAAREMILKDFSDFSGWRKFRMMVAFDAQGNVESPRITRDQVGGVEVVFIGNTEADSFIIKEAEQLRTSGCPYVLVASSDNDIRDACWVNEIIPISATQLLTEMKKARKEMDDYYTAEQRKIASGRLASKVAKTNPGLYEKLEQVRTRITKTL